MKKGVLVVTSVIFIFGSVHGFAHAQVSPSSTPVYPSLNRTAERIFNIDNFGSWLTNTPRFYVGWVESREGVTIGRDRHLPAGDDVLLQRIPYRGVWLGATALIGPVERFGIELEGGALIKHAQKASFELYPPGQFQSFTVEGLDSGYLQALASYELLPAFQIMAGYRTDRYSVRLQNDINPSSYDDFRIDTHLPLLGLKLQTGSGRQHLSLQAIGTAIVYGTLRYHWWNSLGDSASANGAFSSGTMIETTARYGGCFLGKVEFSLFGRWQYVYAKTGDAILSSTFSSVDGSVFQFLHSRSAWTFGIGISAPF